MLCIPVGVVMDFTFSRKSLSLPTLASLVLCCPRFLTLQLVTCVGSYLYYLDDIRFSVVGGALSAAMVLTTVSTQVVRVSYS
jgi:glycopeptide antibiotics resistance protein